MKKRSIENACKVGTGWVRPTEKERQVFVEELRKTRMGRPSVSDKERREVISLRLNFAEITLIRKSALKEGIPWREFIRTHVLDACRID